MGMKDRGYWRDTGGDAAGSSSLGSFTFGMPRPGRAVKVLLIANAAAYIIQLIVDQRGALTLSLGVTFSEWWQPWRYLTFQFLHSVQSPWHIIFNMLGLYMLGSPLEQAWGPKRFTIFYLGCGVAGGVASVLLGVVNPLHQQTVSIGASAGVYGVIMAGAILFPHFQLILLFFPLPIRFAAVIIFGIALVDTMREFIGGVGPGGVANAGHVGGALAAAVWVFAGPRLREGYQYRRRRHREGAWERKMAHARAQQAEIDRILQKIHDQGIASLTRGEKKTLQDASRQQQQREREIDRKFR